MAFSGLTHRSRVGSLTSFVFGTALLSFALFEVFDIDGSNLPTSTASTVLEARQSGDIKQSCPRAIAVARVLDIRLSLDGIGACAAARQSFVVPVRSHFLQSYRALPRANLPEPPSLG